MSAKDKLKVRVYGVRFGDAILIEVPDKGKTGKAETRHILIDVGNAASGEEGSVDVFEPVVDSILEKLDGKPLDLYIMTHEHMDHVKGLLYVVSKFGKKIKVNNSWITASASPDYYEKHPDSGKKKLEFRSIYESIHRFLGAVPGHRNEWLNTVMEINNPRKTDDCVTYLREMAGKTEYVHRETDISRLNPFKEVQFEIWAPEEDTSAYYGRTRHMALNVNAVDVKKGNEFIHELPVPPQGVDVGDFYNLVDMRRRGYMDNALAIDKAANNTSVVFCLTWRGWNLLFTGDAEQKSWELMDKYNKLKPVHFLKVSHHGSSNGVPPTRLLDKIFPIEPADSKKRYAVVSTYPDAYNGIPAKELLSRELELRCELKYVDKGLVKDGEYLEFEFEG